MVKYIFGTDYILHDAKQNAIKCISDLESRN